MSEQEKCELCGEPMPPGEEMFKFHGYSGPCPKPPLTRPGDGGRPSVEVAVPEHHKRAAEEFRKHFREVPLNECEKLADPDYGLDNPSPSPAPDGQREALIALVEKWNALADNWEPHGSGRSNVYRLCVDDLLAALRAEER